MKDRFIKLIERIKTNFNKNRLLNSGLIIVWILIVVLTLQFNRDALGKLSSGNEFYDSYVELTKDVVIQEKVPVEEGADTVAVKFATYARRNSGSFHVSVKGLDSGDVYADKDIKVGNVEDNAFVRIPLNEELHQVKDKMIIIELSSDGEEGKSVGVYYSTFKVFEGSELAINGEIQEGDLTLRYLVKSEELTTFYHIVISWAVITFSLIFFMVLLVKPRYEVIFTLMAVAFGLTFILIITPMSPPDETVHYEYSFQLSNYMMGKDHLYFDEEYQNYGDFAGHFNVSAAYVRFIKKINRPLSLDNKIVKMKFDIEESYKTCFIPQALGITVARLLNWNMLRTFYLGRLFNLIFYIFCVYIAIKKVPVHKLLFGIMATLPIFIQQAASYSYDCFINGLTFVLVAFLLKWMHQEETIDKKEFIFVFICSLLIAPIKVVYGLFVFLYWFVPVERYGSKRNKIIGTLILTAPPIYEITVLLFPLTFRIIRKIFERLTDTEAMDLYRHYLMGNAGRAYAKYGAVYPLLNGDDYYSFAYATSHPLEMLEIFIRTVRVYLKSWFYGSIGRALSGNSLILPTTLVHGMLALLIAASLREEERTEPLWFKIVSLGLCIFAGFMMCGGMLVSWTEINQDIIEDFGGPVIQGIQGRYFSPLLPYVFMLIHNRKIKLPKWIDDYAICAFIAIVFEVVVYVLSYTFVN